MSHFKASKLPPNLTTKALSFVPANLRYRTRASLRALGLIDDDWHVQQRFHELIGAWDTAPKTRLELRMLARDAYPYLADLDLTETTNAELHKAFVQHYGRDDKLLAKAEIFYLNLVWAANRRLSGSLEKRVAASAKYTTPSSAEIEQSAPASRKEDTAMAAKPTKQMTPQEKVERIWELLQMFTGQGLTAEELQAVMTLLNSAKRMAEKAQ